MTEHNTVHTITLEDQGIPRPEPTTYRDSYNQVRHNRCAAAVRRGSTYRQCRNRGEFLHNGSRYCEIHIATRRSD